MSGVRRIFLAGVLCTSLVAFGSLADDVEYGAEYVPYEAGVPSGEETSEAESDVDIDGGVMAWYDLGFGDSVPKKKKKQPDVAQEKTTDGEDQSKQGEQAGSEEAEATDDKAGTGAVNEQPPTTGWQHRRPIHPHIELREYNSSNAHLPRFRDLKERYRHVFYCAKSGNITGLMAVIDELESLGKGRKFVLEELLTKEGDNLLIFSVRNGALDTVRYLLSIGVNVEAKNAKGETPLSVAVDSGNIDMINAISEMKVGFDVTQEE
ncbi:MAG: ankyrin repeat domain-containing protein [Anaplasma sp.]